MHWSNKMDFSLLKRSSFCCFWMSNLSTMKTNADISLFLDETNWELSSKSTTSLVACPHRDRYLFWVQSCLSFFLKYLFIYLAAPGLSCGMQALTGIKPRPPALGMQSLNHWTTRDAPVLSFLISLPSPAPQSGDLKNAWSTVWIPHNKHLNRWQEESFLHCEGGTGLDSWPWGCISHIIYCTI